MSDQTPNDAPAAPTRSSRQYVLAALAGVVLALVAFFAFKALTKSKPATSPSASPTPGVTLPSTTTTSTTTPGTIQSFEIFSSKNPFQPFSTSTGTGTGTGTSTTPGGTTSGTTPSGSTPTTSPGTASTGTGAGGAQEPQTGQRVALQEIFTSAGRTVANVKVNSSVFTVGAGDTFASNFKVVSLSLSSKCGQFLFGDNQFELCQGQEVIK